MSEAESLPGGNLEYAVLAALWKHGPLSGRDVHDRVGVRLGLVYTTTAKVLDRLIAKSLIERARDEKVFVYRARAERSTVERGRMERALGSAFAEEPLPALAGLVAAIEAVDPALLDVLARVVDEQRRQRR